MIPEILEIIGMDLDSLGKVRGKECINNKKIQELLRRRRICFEEWYFK